MRDLKMLVADYTRARGFNDSAKFVRAGVLFLVMLV